MLIFALGLYELFVSRIEIAEGSEFAERRLLIRSLDDLKDHLAKVVLLKLPGRWRRRGCSRAMTRSGAYARAAADVQRSTSANLRPRHSHSLTHPPVG
jgi:hypothetical protein